MSKFKQNNSLTVGFHTPFSEPSNQDAARLLVIGGPLRGASFELSGDTMEVGRRDECPVTLPSPGVSKAHCVLHRDQDGRFSLEDKGSTNGTSVNGRRLDPGARRSLSGGDTIVICDFALIYIAPKSLSTVSPGPVAIDTGAAADEAGTLLKSCEDMLTMARNRRQTRGSQG